MTSPNTKLSFDTILKLTEREIGEYGLATEDLQKRVIVLIDWINERGPYSVDRHDAMQRQLQRLLVTRLRLTADRKRYPGIAAERIEKPIFIVGYARSGTTLVHSLLAEDPEARAPQSWHVLAPSPPPGAGAVAKGRIDFAQRAIEQWMDFCPAQRPMHPYIDKGAHQLIEDEEIFSIDFWLTYPYHLYKVPTLDPFIPLGLEPRSAFRFHRELLQHLQWNTGPARWVCKGPGTQAFLDALLEVYPDALCVWPHRPVAEIYASIVTLTAAIFDTIQGKPRNWEPFGRMLAEGMKAAFDGVIANGLIDDPRVMHVKFRDLAADPVGTVRKIYDRRGLKVTPAFESRLTAWLADPDNQADRYGRYPYSYEALGLSEQWVNDLFAPYSQRFGL